MNTYRTYKGYTLDEARADLELWKEAKRAAATGRVTEKWDLPPWM